jgi:hypothetical protein
MARAMDGQPGASPGERLRALAEGHDSVLAAMAQMQLEALERSGLDEETYLLVRLAALVATDAAPVSYRVHLGDSGALVLPAAKVLATLVAIAPVVGSARVLSAASQLTTAGFLAAAPSSVR